MLHMLMLNNLGVCPQEISELLKVPQISNFWGNLTLYMSIPVGIHQDAKTSISPSSRDGHVSGGLHQRHSDPCRVQGDSS